MKTSSKTTYILLDRGDEDVQLLKELRGLVALAGKFILSQEKTFKFIKMFPKINELIDGLIYETRGEE